MMDLNRDKEGWRERMILMELNYGDILVFTVGNSVRRSRVSKVDGKVVKLFEEDGSYRQVSYENLEKMIEEGFVTVEKGAV